MSMQSLSQTSPLPLYAQLADVLRQRIGRSVWQEGDRLPSVEDLSREFTVARVTVRQAIEVLQRDGLVRAKQGRGTFVTRQKGAEKRLQVQTTLGQLVSMLQGDRPRLLNISEAIATPSLKDTDGKPAATYVYLRRVHFRDDTPYCVISIYLDETVFRQAPERFRNELMIPILASFPGVQIAYAHQTLTIGTADAETAAHLRVPANAPVAEVRRVFRAPDGTVIYLGEVTYRGDLVQLEMDLIP
jgi:GntR family transcriptional regulator